MDPETSYDAIANVGIKDGKIAKITTGKISGEQVIDASGHVVAPGFIDIHAHGQNIGDYRMQAMQGVTTMLELESGVLRSYVRERKLMSLQEALRKMSLMPAQTLEDFVPQMKSKGRLQEGMDADIVVFDPETIADKGTYTEPNQPAVGVQTVQVNGVAVVADGKLVEDAAPGKPIRRSVAEKGEPVKCPEVRPELCTMDYNPVCGSLYDGSFKTFTNGCGACSDPNVRGYSPDECK